MNNIDFDELFNHCARLNESTKEKCLICHIPIQDDEEYLKLICNHYFHNNCVNYTQGKYKCIYCDKISLPKKMTTNLLNNSMCKFILNSGKNKNTPCKRINCKYHKSDSDSNICNFILKSGKNKNTPCKRINCKYHKTDNILV
jgi:hypothetical protein